MRPGKIRFAGSLYTVYLFAFQQLISLPWPLEFHARLSISIQHTSRFILKPNKCLSPVGVSAHKSATTSERGGGVREEDGRGGEEGEKKHCAQTCEDEK